MQVTTPLPFQTHHNVKNLNQIFLLFGSHALGGNCYTSIWAPIPMTWLTGHHLQDQWSRIYHSLSFKFLHALRQETRQIKQDFHQEKVSMVWSLLFSIWELTNTGSKGPKCISYAGSHMQGYFANHFPTFTGALVTLGVLEQGLLQAMKLIWFSIFLVIFSLAQGFWNGTKP